MPFIISFLARFFPTLFAGLGRFFLGFLTPLVGPLIAFFAKNASKITTVVLVYGSVITVMTAAWAGIYLIIGTIKFAAPDELVRVGAMFLPSNFSFCCAALLTAKFAHIVVLLKVRFTEYFLNS